MTPTKMSTPSTNLKEKTSRTPRFALEGEALSPKTFLAPPQTHSNTSTISDEVPLPPQLTRDAQTQGESYFATWKQPSENSVFTERKALKYKYSDDEHGSSLPASRKASSLGSGAPSERMQSAEERATDYTSMLPAFIPEPLHSESSFSPSEMSARITDVFDASLMPAPLVLSGNSEDRKLSSQFSSSGSEVDSLYDDSKPSLKFRAKKAFRSRKASQARKENAHVDSKTSQHSQAGELTTAKRASLQNGIDEMYNTLTGLYSSAKPKMKHDSAHFKSKAIAGDLRRPATLVTLHQKYGKKAGHSPKSPKSPAPNQDGSMGKKLASVFQNGAMAVGLDRAKERRAKTEQWRSQMKKKIVLVRTDG